MPKFADKTVLPFGSCQASGRLQSLTFAAVALVPAAVAASASFLPARKAASADPMEALRAE
ncbi:MAG TPA: hypothetical protein VLN58_16170 [Verrucomicrobiae bacterium]|nr:hypothetical protein [Verrucomicrobiae bacterium]